MSAESERRKLKQKQFVAKELSETVESRIWYLMAECLGKPYPYTLEDKYQFALQLLSK